MIGYTEPRLHPFNENDYTTGVIGMDELACTGDEARLADCPFPGFGSVNCGGNDFVEVTCQVNDPSAIPSQGDIRLANIRAGAFEVRGRIEVFNDGFWVRVCDDNFDIFDAAVACRQLGYSSIGKWMYPPTPLLCLIFVVP